MINRLYLAILLAGVGVATQGLQASADQALDLVATVNFDDGVIVPGARVGLLACKERLDQSLELGDLVGARIYLGLLATMLGSGGEVQYALPGQSARSVRLGSLVIGQKNDQVDLILHQVFNVSFESLNRYSLVRKQSAIDNFVFQAQRMLKFKYPKNCSIEKIKTLLGRSILEAPLKTLFLKSFLRCWGKIIVGSVVTGVVIGAVLFSAFVGLGAAVYWGAVTGLGISIAPTGMVMALILAYWDDEREDRD